MEGARRYSSDLPQGGTEIPCKLIFRGTVDELQKVTKYFRDALGIDVCICKTDENSIVTAAHTVCKSVATMNASTAMNMAALTHQLNTR